MSSSVLHRSLRQAASLRRCMSSNTPNVSTSSNATLPDHKMRALISLYHQSEKYITLENLDSEIDKMFAVQFDKGQHSQRDTAFPELEKHRRDRDSLPKLTKKRGGETTAKAVEKESGDKSLWSEPGTTEREGRVYKALYGIYAKGKPQLEVLREGHERVKKDFKEDA
ncbi:hypothetical protein C8Q75DRAFT_268012 [Abortiporus biennis]|nr:hypothetical protein C8Q75DRAFT_268012 [Abortiporus biennis]